MKYYLSFLLLLFFISTRLFSQTASSLPDNIVDTDCYTHVSASRWGIQFVRATDDTPSVLPLPLAGDIDNDGRIEIVSTGIRVLNPSDSIVYSTVFIYDDQLVKKDSFLIPAREMEESVPITLADVDNDGIAEVFVVCNPGRHFGDAADLAQSSIVCYNYDGNTVTRKWRTEFSIAPGSIYYCHPVIADINADGIPDILVNDRIYNAQTGELEVVLPKTVGIAGYAFIGQQIAVLADMDNDGILEVVGCNEVIKVNITNPYGTGGNFAYLWKTVTGQGISGSGFTSVADINLDGFLDVVVVAGSTTTAGGYSTYVWQPYTGPSSTPEVLGIISGSSFFGGGSIALAADLNNDGYPEIAWSSVAMIQAYQYIPETQDFQLLWRHTTNDASGLTGMSAFDFDQDGILEVVYRDQTHLRILDGRNGNNRSAIPCNSKTGIEYPIIVDLDQDGSAEILVSESASSGTLGWSGRICCYKHQNGSMVWAPARPVWNQYVYNIVHINQDLTVPSPQFNPATTFINPATPGIVRRPFNNFLQQATILDHYGEPLILLADGLFIEDSITLRKICDTVQITLYIHNQGSYRLLPDFNITTYKNTYGGEVIRIDTIAEALPVDSSRKITLTFTLSELSVFSPIDLLVFTLNDAGNGIAQTGGEQSECDITNNLFSIPVFENIHSNNATCVGDTLFLKAIDNSGNYPIDWSINSIEYLDTTELAILIEEPGILDIRMIVRGECPDTTYLTIHTNYPPMVQLPADTTICLHSSISAISGNTESWQWSNGNDSAELLFPDEGSYTLIASNSCATDTLTVDIHFFEPLEVNIGKDSILCELATLLLDATHPAALSYLWQDESRNATYMVYYDGEYWVIVTDHCMDKSDTVNISYLMNLDVDLGNDTLLCTGKQLLLDVSRPYCQYVWQDGNSSPKYLVREPGRYSVRVYNLCFSVSDTIYVEMENCDLDLHIPNAFTPNSNSINDLFLPYSNFPEQITHYRMSIYNRWGSLIFHTDNLYQGWDGQYKGNDCPFGVYTYRIEYSNENGKQFTKTGSVTLVR